MPHSAECVVKFVLESFGHHTPLDTEVPEVRSAVAVVVAGHGDVRARAPGEGDGSEVARRFLDVPDARGGPIDVAMSVRPSPS